MHKILQYVRNNSIYDKKLNKEMSTIHHILLHCPTYNCHRTIFKLNNKIDWILSDASEHMKKIIFVFLKSTGLASLILI